MGGDLAGARVAVLEARMSDELATLVRRWGGQPYSVPAVREEALDCAEQVADFIDGFAANSFAFVIFTTGVGATALCKEAERMGRLPELLEALRRVVVVCRGPKPTAVLTRYGVPVTVKAQEPYTTAEVLDAVSSFDLSHQGVALLHYGERNAALADALHARGAQVKELYLYQWQLPDDLAALKELVREIIDGRVAAVAFTSQIQARHLFQVAAEMQQSAAMTQALNTGAVVVAAVGPTCAAALADLGVTPHVVPQTPKMGPMISALAAYVGQSRATDAN